MNRRQLALWISLTCLLSGVSLISIASASVSKPDISKILDLVTPEPPMSDLWIYESGNVGLRQRVLDVFTTGPKRGDWVSLRGDEPAYTFGSPDDLRWQECRKIAKTEAPGLWLVCVESDRLYEEVHPDPAKLREEP